MKFLLLITLLIMTVFNAAYSESSLNKSSWNGANNPSIMSSSFIRDYNRLPKSGSIVSKGLGWSGSYWPTLKGGIAQRWVTPYIDHFEYESPTRTQALSMSQREIDSLSPAEKYDLFVGNYSYPTVKRARETKGALSKVWHGICHGVAPASLNYPEPQTVQVTSPEGINITFYSSDVKALLAYYYANVDNSDTHQVGKRCFVGRFLSGLSQWNGCKDVNAGAFHIILANKLGIDKTGFIADLDRLKQVWNHAALEFKSVQLFTDRAQRNSAQGTAYRVYVRTQVKYAASIDPEYNPVIGTRFEKFDTRTYKYWLELDYNDRIIGGEWDSKKRPDFLWTKPKVNFEGYFSKIHQIYKTRY